MMVKGEKLYWPLKRVAQKKNVSGTGGKWVVAFALVLLFILCFSYSQTQSRQAAAKKNSRFIFNG